MIAYKRRMLSLSLVLSALSLPAAAADPFTTEQKAGIAMLGAVMYDDYKQTLDIKNHIGMPESNRFLGEHPSDARIRNYFVGVSVTSLVALYAMPSKYRKFFIAGGLILEVQVTGRNQRIGLKGAF